MNKNIEVIELDRRDFLKGASASTIAAAMGTAVLNKAWAQDEYQSATEGESINVGLIGCGYHGRELIGEFPGVAGANLAAICETYPAYLRRAGRMAKDADRFEDYQELLKRDDIPAVVIATPTQLHREITIAALEAGKHVYLEAPIANTIDDARAIAQAAKANPQAHFQAGLQLRSDPQRQFVMDFIRTGAMGNQATGRAQHNQKASMRRSSPNRDRELELNWRLDKTISTGLAGEFGVHQIDAASWIYGAKPKAVTGFGSIVNWKDGRTVDDTIHALFEYEGGTLFHFDSTLASSFDAAYEVFQGSLASVMFRDGSKAWMFKEADAPALGWEVYAQKDDFYKETGIALLADATKQASRFAKDGEKAAEPTLFHWALESFATNAILHNNAVKDFSEFYDIEDKEGLVDYLSDIESSKLPYADYKRGFEATVTSLIANEAVMGRKRIEISEDSYSLS